MRTRCVVECFVHIGLGKPADFDDSSVGHLAWLPTPLLAASKLPAFAVPCLSADQYPAGPAGRARLLLQHSVRRPSCCTQPGVLTTSSSQLSPSCGAPRRQPPSMLPPCTHTLLGLPANSPLLPPSSFAWGVQRRPAGGPGAGGPATQGCLLSGRAASHLPGADPVVQCAGTGLPWFVFSTGQLNVTWSNAA